MKLYKMKMQKGETMIISYTVRSKNIETALIFCLLEISRQCELQRGSK